MSPMQQMFLGLGGPSAVEYNASNSTNIVLATVFGTDWAADKEKIYNVPSGVTIGGTGSAAALVVSSGMAGTLVINVSGTVIGKGGSGGSGGAGGTGGDGAGYNQSASVGGGGSAGAHPNAGSGGSGGNGGSLGSAGSNGSQGNAAAGYSSFNGTPGFYGSGGAAGKAISNAGASWTNGTTSGTYHGSYT